MGSSLGHTDLMSRRSKKDSKPCLKSLLDPPKVERYPLKEGK